MSILLIRRSSDGREFHSLGAATWNALSPRVTLVLIEGASSKTALEERKLYAPCDFTWTRSWIYKGAMPCIALNVNSSILKWMRCLIGSQCNSCISGRRQKNRHWLLFIIWPVRPRARFHCETIEKIPVWGPYVMARAGPEKAVRTC